MIRTTEASEIRAFRDNADYALLETTSFAETNYILLNVAVGENVVLGAARGSDPVPMDPADDNASSPLIDLRVRKALAAGIDRRQLVEQFGAGIVPVANGPFAPGSVGHVADTGYPSFDTENGGRLLDDYIDDSSRNDEKEVGSGIEFTLTTTTKMADAELATLVATMLREAYGDRVSVFDHFDRRARARWHRPCRRL